MLLEWLTFWITQILIFIIVATIVDLMMPTNNMRKYVTFVLRLFLLYIFLQPMMLLFSINMQDISYYVDDMFTIEAKQYDAMYERLDKEANAMQIKQMENVVSDIENQWKRVANEHLTQQNLGEIERIQIILSENTLQEKDVKQVMVFMKENVHVSPVKQINMQDTYEQNDEQTISIIHTTLQNQLSEMWSIDGKLIEFIWE